MCLFRIKVILYVMMEKVDVYELCRICLKLSQFYSNIYKECSTDGSPLCNVINEVCGLGVSVDDGLPEFLCRECFKKLHEFKLFKTNAHKGRSELILMKQAMENEIWIKKEPPESLDTVEPAPTFVEGSLQDRGEQQCGDEECPTEQETRKSQEGSKENSQNKRIRTDEAISQTSKRLKLTKSRTKEVGSLHSEPAKDDEFSIFGRSIAAQLKKVPIEQAILAQNEIQAILTRYRLRNLQKPSETPVCSSRSSVTPPIQQTYDSLFVKTTIPM